MRLYLIRHGQSTNNAQNNEGQRVEDAPLTELGKRQADTVAHYLVNGIERLGMQRSAENIDVQIGGFNITKLFCSGMSRALQTALPISKVLNLNPEVWVETHEEGGIYLDKDGSTIGYGGRTRQEILDEFPHYVLPLNVTDQGWWILPRRETPEEAQERARLAAAKLKEWVNSNEHIALVTHGNFMNYLIKALIDSPLDTPPYFMHRNTGITRIDFRNGFTDIIYVNRITHLPSDMIS